jgi:PadR family transcriptional regulator PadR
MKADALRGHLDSLILAVVDEQPLHGYAIIEALRVRSGGRLDVPSGTVYPALRRLESAGYLTSGWSAEGGRKRRTYVLSASGRRALAAQRQEWVAFSAVVDAVLRPT